MNKKFNLIILGSSGQLGKEFQGLSNKYQKEFTYNFLTKGKYDVTKQMNISECLSDISENIIINCSAYTKVDLAEKEKEKAMLINGLALGNITKIANDTNSTLVHFSTDYVFSGDNEIPYREEDATDPQTSYGESKLYGENLALNSTTKSIVIRTSWLYSSMSDNFVKTIISKSLTNETLNIVADQKGSPTYARDLAEAVLKLILLDRFKYSASKNSLYHYSNLGITSWYEFAYEIFKSINADVGRLNPIKTDAYNATAKRPKYSALNTSKIRDHFNLEIPLWEKSLMKCINNMGMKS